MRESYLTGGNEHYDATDPPEPSHDPAVLAHNAQLVRWMIKVWLDGVASQRIRPGSLGSTPAALLVANHNQLGYDEANDVLVHDEAYSWWTVVYDHGTARRLHRNVQQRHQGRPLFHEFPIPLWLLYELDMAFDTLHPSHNLDQNKLEVLFEPNITGLRLIKALETVIAHLPIDPTTLQEVIQQIVVACQ